VEEAMLDPQARNRGEFLSKLVGEAGEPTMFFFALSHDWADFMAMQMAVSSGSADPKDWGYACLCIGDRLEEAIRRHYLEIDRLTGQHLHVFSFVRPPHDRLIRMVRDAQMNPRAAELLPKLERIKNKSWIEDDPGRYAGEKDRLITELRECGVRANSDTAFVFFQVASVKGGIDFDVVATRESPLRNNARDSEIEHLFERMGTKATESFSKGQSASQYVRTFDLPWAVPVALRKAETWLRFVESFRKTFEGKG
jgi:hypothetical protein